ncbi:Hypothetical predicted protein [Podarcis lilfordi]|uniref:Uncharacterized protein n=1 Tax=Podarcis lilfordi TaxID=74358 RepID=A0AA35PI53_9SAUR|nr:Hypothetical predicted protein [Podarcis lilfordi]
MDISEERCRSFPKPASPAKISACARGRFSSSQIGRKAEPIRQKRKVASKAFLKLYLNQPCRSVQKKNNSSLAHTCILHSGSRKERQGSSCTMTRIFRHELQNFLLLLYYIMEVLQCPAILVTIQTLTEADPNS